MASTLLDERQTVEMLADAEEKIGEIYAIFAGWFPHDGAFWERLRREEAAHARWVRELLPLVVAGQVTFRESRLGTPAFALFHDYLVQHLRELKAAPLSETAALAVAVDIESTLVEKSFYDVFTSEDPESARLLALLSKSAEAHLHAVNRHWLARHAKSY